MKRCVLLPAVAVVLVGSSPLRAELTVGDPAPKFIIDNWLQGAPEELAAGKGKKIYVLDFWATWCLGCLYQIPELSELQRRYRDQGVVVIGVTGPIQGQHLDQVRQFLKMRADAMTYTVGWDSSARMWDNYLTAVGAEGIPYLFIVARDGRIAWHGHPSPDMERVLEALVAGSFDMDRAITRARKQPQIRQMLSQFNLAAMMKNWPQALELLDQILQLDPTHEQALVWAYQIRVNEMGAADADVRAWVEAFINKHKHDSAGLTAMSRLLMMIEEPAQRLPDLMLRAARAAYQVGGGRDIAATELYARAAYRVGHLDEAIRLQTLAVEAASQHRKAELAKTLAYYQACRRLRDTEF